MSSPPTTNGGNGTTDDGTTSIEWRMNVKQSYRNGEVRQIAKVLANLEPGATEASKLRLAMQFEDSIFQIATSLSDYHKRLTKRLNKLLKTYVPATASSGTTVSTVEAQKKKEKAINDLIAKYGKDVKYVVENSIAAVKEMCEKYGEEKATQLQQHVDGVKLWAIDLGIVPETDGGVTKPNMTMSDAHLERLKSQLEKRLTNVRSHTVKLVHPDLFLQESLQRIQDEFKDKGRVVRVQADNMRKRYEQLQHVITSQQQQQQQPNQTNTSTSGSGLSTAIPNSETFDPNKLLTQALEQASKPVPVIINNVVTSSKMKDGTPTSSATTANNIAQQQMEWEVRKRAALIHLEKMRAASTVLVAYLCVPDKYSVPPNALAMAHTVAMDGIDVVQNVMHEFRTMQQQQLVQHQGLPSPDKTTETLNHSTTHIVQLHDAWLKPITIPMKEVSLLDNNDTLTTSPTKSEDHSAKIQKHQRTSMILRTRVLCTSGRKTPSNLVIALQNKGVTLARPLQNGSGSYAQIQFEQAFVMRIYFVPLLVTYRAYNRNDSSTFESDQNDVPSSSLSCGVPSWTQLYDGLSNRTDELLNVNGILKGKYDSVGWIIEEYLRDASAHATNVLRQCFKKTTTAENEFEIELLEASALLEFIQLARDTYLPNNKDHDTKRKRLLLYTYQEK
jgi:hypothetical protein